MSEVSFSTPFELFSNFTAFVWHSDGIERNRFQLIRLEGNNVIKEPENDKMKRKLKTKNEKNCNQKKSENKIALTGIGNVLTHTSPIDFSRIVVVMVVVAGIPCVHRRYRVTQIRLVRNCLRRFGCIRLHLISLHLGCCDLQIIFPLIKCKMLIKIFQFTWDRVCSIGVSCRWFDESAPFLIWEGVIDPLFGLRMDHSAVKQCLKMQCHSFNKENLISLSRLYLIIIFQIRILEKIFKFLQILFWLSYTRKRKSKKLN